MSDLQTAQDFDQLIQSRFAGQQGWFCLGTIDGDPRIEKLHQEWYQLPRQRSDLAERCAHLASRWFNLYWAACLFERRQRSYAAALPSNILWQDDAPADSICSELIQSSARSYQATITLDRPLSARDRQRLQTAWRDLTPGADSCSGNAVQMGRMPGGYNRKQHGQFLVTVVRHTDRIWSADQLLADAPQSAAKARAATVADLDWPAVEPHLTNITALLGSARAACIKPDSQTGRILAGERVAIPSARYGRMDDSHSAQAAILAYGFYCRGFLDDEIAAVVMHFYRLWGVEGRKGTIWCKADIARVIAHAHEKKPSVLQSPTRYGKVAAAEPIADVPAASRARHDRPTRLDPPMLFARYQAEPELRELKRKERAARLGIATATLDRLDDGLETIGLIEIVAMPGMPGRVVLMGGVINIPPPEVLSPSVAAPEAESQNIRAGSGQTADPAPQCIGGTHPPPGPQPSAAVPPGLTLGVPAQVAISIVTPRHGRASDAIYEAIVAIDTQPLIDVLDRKTGEVRQIKLRVNKQRVDRYLQEQHNIYVLPEVLDELYPEQLERRTRERKIAALADLNPTGLRAQLRLAEHMADKHKALDEPVARWWAFYRDMARKELMSRPADPERPKGGRKNCEALPDMRAAGGRRQAELWDAAEDAIEAQRVERRGRPASTRVARGTCVPPNPAPAGAPPAGGPSDAPRDIVARLNALKAQRESLAALQ